MQIGAGGTGASIGGSSAIYYNAAALTFNQADNTTYGGTIKGTGMFSQQGPGQLTFSGSTATGTALVTGGSLALAGTHTCTGLQASGGAIVVSGSVNVANAYFYIGNGGTNNGIGGTSGGQLIINNGATLNVTGNLGDNFVDGRDSGSGTITQSGGLFNYNPSQTAFYVCASNNANTNAFYYMNGGTLNLNGKALDVGFGASAAASGTMIQSGGAVTNVGTLNVGVSSGNGCYNLSGGSLVIGSGGIVGAATYSINLSGGTIAASTNWTSAANMTLSGGAPSGSGSVTFNNAGDTIGLSGVLSGSGGLIATGGGTLTLSGSNTFTGPTTINAGTLSYGASGALPATNTVNVNGGILNIGSQSPTLGQVTLAGGAITGGAGSLLTSTSNYQVQSGTVAANLAGNVGLVKSGAPGTPGLGTVVLSSTQSYTGATVINGGTLRLAGTSLPAGTVAYYSFNNANNLGADSSGFGNNLAAASGTRRSAAAACSAAAPCTSTAAPR